MSDRIAAFRAMIEKQPGNALARFGLSNELLKAQRFEEAVQELALYLDQHDDEGNGWLRYAEALNTIGRTDEALVAIKRGTANAARFNHGTLVSEFQALADEIASAD